MIILLEVEPKVPEQQQKLFAYTYAKPLLSFSTADSLLLCLVHSFERFRLTSPPILKFASIKNALAVKKSYLVHYQMGLNGSSAMCCKPSHP